jgi:flagellar motor switch/type III secretory pathway protein FliN
VLVQPDGTRDKRLLHPRVIRVGRDSSCHVQLASGTVSREHLEIRVDDEGKIWIVDLQSTSGTKVNGYALEPFAPRPLVAGDQVDVHPFRLVVGKLTESERQPYLTLAARAPLHLEDVDPFALLSGPGDHWVRVAAGDWNGWVQLPMTWLPLAYRSLGYPPPPADATTTDVDLAITSFLLARAAAVFTERTGRTVQVSRPLTPSAAAAGEELPAAWDGTRFAVDVSGVMLESAVLWAAGTARASQALPRWLEALAMPVAVELGVVSLPAEALRRIERGDALLADEWYSKAWPPPPGGGAVLLRVRGGVRTASLRPRADAAGGGTLELVVESSWSQTPRGAVMGAENPQAQRSSAGVAAAGPAGAEPLRVPEDLEAVVAFELDRIDVPVGELGRWQPGATLTLERTPEDPVRIVLHQGGGARLLGTGRVVVVDGRLGVQIEQWLVESPR